jgi:hypothetical protein
MIMSTIIIIIIIIIIISHSLIFVFYFKLGVEVLVNLTQLVGTMYNICKVRGSNPDHHKKKKKKKNLKLKSLSIQQRKQAHALLLVSA